MIGPTYSSNYEVSVRNLIETSWETVRRSRELVRQTDRLLASLGAKRQRSSDIVELPMATPLIQLQGEADT